MDDEELIQEQIEYYRRRAPEYDETSSPPGDPLAAYGEELVAALDRFRPAGRVLEIASGTGAWTRYLLSHASAVNALDSSPEMHALSRRKLGHDPRVRYVEADVFSWEPDGQFDVVFFANWLSHVPPTRFDRFWRTVREALAPEGRVFLVDEIKDAWRNEELSSEVTKWFMDLGSAAVGARDSPIPVVRRPLRDGRVCRVVKDFWDPDKLKAQLGDLGWDLTVHAAGPFFWAEGQPASNSANRGAGYRP